MKTKALRTRLGLTQKELSEILGAHPMTISRWERGVLEPTPHHKRLLRALSDAAERGLHVSGAQGRGRAVGGKKRDPVRFLSEVLASAYARPEIDLGTLSATNRFAGRVIEIARGDVMSKVVIALSPDARPDARPDMRRDMRRDLRPDLRIGAVITTDSVDRLGLEIGSRAIAIIKATEVIVGSG
jgi:molybdopterin-binding protein